jgi:hypothetical protein
MTLAIQILVALFVLPLTFLGTRAMFAPVGLGDEMSIALNGAAGRNTMRGVLGGLFLASAAMLALGLFTQQTTWFLAVALLMAAVVVGRVVGIVADGFDHAVVPPLVVEIVIGSGLVAAHTVLG